MTYVKRFQDQLFTALELACLVEGGDGESALITPDYLAAADAFEAWLKRTDNTHWSRFNADTHVVYHNNQEDIWFFPSRDEADRLYPHIISYFETLVWDL